MSRLNATCVLFFLFFCQTAFSDDLAIVLLDDTSGDLIQDAEQIVLKAILSKHYKSGNILYTTPSELKACNLELEDIGLSGCPSKDGVERNYTPAACCSPNKTDPNKQVEADSTKFMKLAAERCPFAEQFLKKTSTSESVDVVAGTHGGSLWGILAFNDFLGFQPALRQKMRLFYSGGCSEAKNDKFAAYALRAGFTTFVGHEGFSFSPLVFPKLFESLFNGATPKEAAQKVNHQLGNAGTALKGTMLNVFGKQDQTLTRTPSPESKFCELNHGIKPLSELANAGCLVSRQVLQYYIQFPKLIDQKFCKEKLFEKTPEYGNMLPFGTISIAACVAAGFPLEELVPGIKDKILKSPFNDFFLSSMLDITHARNCLTDQQIGRLINCFKKNYERLGTKCDGMTDEIRSMLKWASKDERSERVLALGLDDSKFDCGR